MPIISTVRLLSKTWSPPAAPKIPEPPVEFTVRLAALDWGGVTRAADEQGDDDDDDFDDDDFDE